MPQWAGSSWYFLRYPSVGVTDAPFAEADMNYWMPVDLYVGGVEHAILHLLYARFYTKVLYDQGCIRFDEPFTHLFNQGMVNKYSEKSGLVEKMSKSKGNVVNPDEIVAQYGSDVLRAYMLFMGPPELDCEWQDSGIEGIKRFITRVWNFYTSAEHIVPQEQEQLAVTRRVHRFLKEYMQRLEQFKPNTALASAMELFNDLQSMQAQVGFVSAQSVLVALSTIMPFTASEILDRVFHTTLEKCTWPVYNAELAADHEATIAIQVNGKTRGTITVAVNASQDTVHERALQEVSKWLEGMQVRKVIYVPGRMISFVVVPA